MAETRKTTKSKTKPAKKPAAKPAGKSVKPKEVKTVRATVPKAATPKTSAPKPAAVKSNAPKATNQHHGLSALALIFIIIAAGLAVIAGITFCVINNCMTRDEVVLIENGKGEQVESKYVSLENYKYRVLVPTSFKVLTAEEIAKDYGTTEAPELVYANEENTVNVAFSKPNNSLKNDEVKEYLDAMKTILNTSMDVISAETVEKDGHTVGVLKVVSELDDEKIYNEMAFFSYEDKLAIVTFNCRDKVRSEWEKVGNAIIDSLKF